MAATLSHTICANLTRLDTLILRISESDRFVMKKVYQSWQVYLAHLTDLIRHFCHAIRMGDFLDIFNVNF